MKNAFKSMFKVIANLVAQEYDREASMCGEESPHKYVCSRGQSHQGPHLAIGDEDTLLEGWLGSGWKDHSDSNEDIAQALIILTDLVHMAKDNSCPTGNRNGMMCLRKNGHKGLHVAVAGKLFCATWE